MLHLGALLVTGLLLTAAAAPDQDVSAPEAPVEPAPEPSRASATIRPGASSWFALPVVFWLPETRLGIGAAGGVHYHLAGAPRTSNVFLVGAYTLDDQSSADLAGDIYLRSGILLAGRIRAVQFPDAFYGLGANSTTDQREPFTRRYAEAILAGEAPLLSRRLRAGVRMDLRTEDISDLAPGGVLSSGAVEGAHGFSAVGLGGVVTWDSRDRPLFPSCGSFLEAWVLEYPEALGRHREFSRANVEGRTFLPLGGERIVGASAFIEEAFGDVPFTLLPKLGSTRFLRGWREGRFRDRVAFAAQTELRLPLRGRIYGTVFGAFGDVAPDLGAFRADSLKVAGGLGLRYRLTPEGANVRLDLAESQAGPELYVLLLEAF